jgi:co-chaperonin GroES (HSP10)
MNETGIVPLGRAILVEPFEPEREKSVIALPDSVKESQRLMDTKVRVIAVGPGAWPDEDARAHPGDIVFIPKYQGFIAQGPNDGKFYRLVNDRDIFAKVVHFEGEHHV